MLAEVSLHHFMLRRPGHDVDVNTEFISGFSGSAGTAIITQEKAALATDGRYFNQAEKQLDNNWTLLKQGLQDVPTWQEWSAEQSEGGKIVGVDPTTITARMSPPKLQGPSLTAY